MQSAKYCCLLVIVVLVVAYYVDAALIVQACLYALLARECVQHVVKWGDGIMKQFFFRHITSWSTYVSLAAVILANLFCVSYLRWNFILTFIGVFVLNIPFTFALTWLELRMQLRAKTFEYIDAHPNSDTFDFEHDGRLWHGTVEHITVDHGVRND